MHKCILIFFITFFILSAAPLASWAAEQSAGSACDPEYFKKLEEKATQEAQRAILQTYASIEPPQSVLVFSCFDKLVAEYEKNAEFSKTQEYGENTSPDQLASDLETGPLSASREYVARHYLDTDSLKYIKDAGGYETCNSMNVIWEAAKCKNYTDIGSGFISLKETTSEIAKCESP